MEKEVKTTMWIDECNRVTASYSDFDGGLNEWKDAFYTMWRYQMTYSFAYSIRVAERRKTGVYIEMYVQPNFINNVVETMEGLGYHKIMVEKEKVATLTGDVAYDLGVEVTTIE